MRQRLITLRDTEIKPAFPDSPAEKGLIWESLLEEFIQKRPKTKDDWFRKIPQELRTSVGRTWLDYVGHPTTEKLQVIERYRRPDFTPYQHG